MPATEVTYMSFGAAVIWVVLGILASLILPVSVNYLRNTMEASFWEKLKKAWKKYNGNRYLLILLSAVVIGVILIVAFNMQFTTIRDAFMVGFAWESLVSKLFGGSKGS